MADKQRLTLLKNFILFSELDDEELAAIDALLESKSYPGGATIFFEGDRGDRVYFVRDGKIKALKSTPDGDEQILEVLQPGDIFGEVVLFGIDHYPATARTVEDVQLDYLSRSRFREYFYANPDIGWGMLRVMARKLYRSQRKIGNLGLNDTRGRVATLIIDMLHDFGETETEFMLDFNRQELANFIGTSRETVSRTLSDFRSEGLIEIKRDKILIRDLAGLRAVGGELT